MPSLSFWLLSLLSTSSSVFASPTRTLPRNSGSPFVTASPGGLVANGSKFSFIGTNAYWLPYLNSDDDISNTLANMSASGINVVRTWAFNDVTTIPEAGSWLQLIANGTATINTGPNGLQRLDKLVELAAQQNIHVILSLTNNWNPTADLSASHSPVRRNEVSPTPFPRNFLSNDYGGMDAYVREFSDTKAHDEFYTDQTIRKFFEQYIQAVVSRFVNNPRVLAWELANDPRCNSTLPSSESCNTNTITRWHADIAKFIRSIDPNHLISSGNHGFFCPSCPKLFFNPLPPPQPSSAPGGTRKRTAGGITPSKLLRMITEERRAAPRALDSRDGVKIRGRWMASLIPIAEAKRQTSGVGPAFDGSFGVDSLDILSIPNIDFGSFQLFPDQNSYGTIATQFTPPSVNLNETVQQGIAWIQAQAASAKAVDKPLALIGFGLVTQVNLQSFVPFNATSPVVTPPPQNQKRKSSLGTFGTGVTDQQRDSAYASWLQAGIQAGLSGLSQYQPANGTFVQSSSGAGTLGVSPNDGYGIIGCVIT
ncbi:glycoside hydrolase [Multifurca ochricompacta]|uniref:mannan endo-1,4-beta-mannosidase n=1 Tax=Multifurca ochricompacta TaxID=376703 RepID=A0AAD4QQF0_9AGAM|nr:glycoside hydrolase [Multifurca ochricompacta]